MYMFNSSLPEAAAIWIISDVRALTKVKSDSKESTDGKERQIFMTLNSWLSIKWNGYLPRAVVFKSKIISFPFFGKDTGVGSMSQDLNFLQCQSLTGMCHLQTHRQFSAKEQIMLHVQYLSDPS